MSTPVGLVIRSTVGALAICLLVIDVRVASADDCDAVKNALDAQRKAPYRVLIKAHDARARERPDARQDPTRVKVRSGAAGRGMLMRDQH